MEIGQMAERIVTEQLGEQVQSCTPIIGNGSVNQVFLLQLPSGKVVVRMNDHERTLLEYQKEGWCIAAARAQGIPVSSVLSIGAFQSYAYMIQTFVAGEVGTHSQLDKQFIWRQMGSYLKRMQAISVQGYGENLADRQSGLFQSPLHAGFDGTWKGFLDYNIQSLTAQDELIQLGVLSIRQSKMVRQQFEQLLDCPFAFGLYHGDISLKNTIVAADGTVHLIDWGCAGVSVMPHWEFVQVMLALMSNQHPHQAALRALAEGYGFSQSEYQDMQPLLNTLLMLLAFDKLRWAIDCAPEQINNFVANASAALRYAGV